MKTTVPEKCIVVVVRGSSPRNNWLPRPWSDYRIHKAGEQADHPPKSSRANLLEPGQSFVFPWCPVEPDEDFQYRVREVTITNVGGEAKENVRVTKIIDGRKWVL